VCRDAARIERQNQSPRQSHRSAAKNATRYRKLTRRRGRWRRARSARSGGGATRRRANLIANFLDSSAAGFIEDGNHVAVAGHSFRANFKLYFPVSLVEAEKTGSKS